MTENIILNRVKIIRNYSIGGELSRSLNEQIYKERCINPNESKRNKSHISRAERKYSSQSDDKGTSKRLKINEELRVALEHFENLEKKVEFLVKKKEIIGNIIKERRRAASIIINKMRVFTKEIKIRKNLIIEQFLLMRRKCSITIQKNFREFRVKKHINNLRKDYDFVFYYNYIEKDPPIKEDIENNSKNNLIQNSSNYNNRLNLCNKEIKLKFGKDSNEYIFKYSPFLKIHYLPLRKQGIMRKRFKVNFIIDGTTIIDPRYEVDNDRNGFFFNIIESNMFWKRIPKSKEALYKKPITENKKKSKFWENIFEIKNNSYNNQNGTSSVSDISEQNDAVIDKLLNRNSLNRNCQTSNQNNQKLRSILKQKINPKERNRTLSNESNTSAQEIIPTKHVSFNATIQFSN